MKAPDGWNVRSSVIPAPWVHPAATPSFDTLLDAFLAAKPDVDGACPWIILEDGRLITPAMVAKSRMELDRGHIPSIASLLDA